MTHDRYYIVKIMSGSLIKSLIKNKYTSKHVKVMHLSGFELYTSNSSTYINITLQSIIIKVSNLPSDISR